MTVKTDLGIDLGSSNVLVYMRGKGVVVKEPAIVAYDKDTDKVIAIGEEARQMIGRLPGNIMSIRPLRQGVISDYVITEKMLKYFVAKAMGLRIIKKPRITIALPSSLTQVEKKAVEEAAYQAGARSVTLVEQPVAAAIGAGIDITKPAGNMLVVIGGGLTDIAVVTTGGISAYSSIKTGGDSFNEAIVRYLRSKFELFIGEQTAESIKIRIGTAIKRPGAKKMKITGRNVKTGLPMNLELDADTVCDALNEVVTRIVSEVQSVLLKTPPELAVDIAGRGIILAGGGAKLDGLEERIEHKTGVNTVIAEDPEQAVAIGAGTYLETMAAIKTPFSSKP